MTAEFAPGEIQDELIPELVFPALQPPRQAKAPPVIAVVRALTPDDVPAIRNAMPGPPTGGGLKSLRHSHHQLARLIAQGAELAHISLVTGYAPGYVSSIQRDPTFAGLVQYYAIEREEVFIDTLARMKSLGITVLEELQSRLAEAPEKWSIRELQEFAKLLLIEPGRQAPVQGQGPAGSGVAVTVNFVSPAPQPESGPLIEGQAA